MSFQPGDFVAIVTVNGGRAIHHERDKVEETWAGRIIGPSPIGEGWWLVRKIDPKTGRGSGTRPPYTIPESEMRKP